MVESRRSERSRQDGLVLCRRRGGPAAEPTYGHIEDWHSKFVERISRRLDGYQLENHSRGNGEVRRHELFDRHLRDDNERRHQGYGQVLRGLEKTSRWKMESRRRHIQLGPAGDSRYFSRARRCRKEIGASR